MLHWNGYLNYIVFFIVYSQLTFCFFSLSRSENGLSHIPANPCKLEAASEVFVKLGVDGSLLVSEEINASGSRKYSVVRDVKKFWEFINQKHFSATPGLFYELYTKHKPFKLFFDLDFKTVNLPQMNLTVNGYLNYFLGALSSYARLFNYPELSDRDKYLCLFANGVENQIPVHSIHVISNHGKYFRKIEEVKQFVVNFIKYCENAQDDYLIGKLSRSISEVIDTRVYTINRNFRLLLNCKFKNRTRPFLLNTKEPPYDLIIFTASLIQPLHAIEEADYLPSVPRNNTEIPYYVGTSLDVFDAPLQAKIKDLIGGKRILNIKQFAESRVVFYINMADDKFCRNVNREHTNNNVTYVANIVLQTVRQRCHNITTCLGYLSDPL